MLNIFNLSQDEILKTVGKQKSAVAVNIVLGVASLLVLAALEAVTDKENREESVETPAE